MKKRIAPEIKEQIINRIKNDGVTVAQAAKDTVYQRYPYTVGSQRKSKVSQRCRKSSNSSVRMHNSCNSWVRSL